MRKSWRVFHYRSLLGRCFRDFILYALEYFSAQWCSAADTHLNKLQDIVVSSASFLTGVYLSVTLLIIDLWQVYSEYCISGVAQCKHSMVLYLRRMCQRALHAVLCMVAHRYTHAPPCCRTRSTA